jgi:hypothetical protein
MSRDSLIIYFGCSWTWGRFINWEKTGIKDAHDLDPVYEKEQSKLHSYRSLITNYYGADSINFSEGGSSNDRQFRRASEYFFKIEKMSDIENFGIDLSNYKKIIVLWFITSTARSELYNSDTKKYDNFFYIQGGREQFAIAEDLVKRGYWSEEEEIKKINAKQILWNSWFKENKIINFWIDTFNHHDYPVKLNNHINFGTGYSDLMSNMYLKAMPNIKPLDKFKMHLSAWRADEERSKCLSYLQYLNRSTLHPTVKGHKLIADLLIPELDKHL